MSDRKYRQRGYQDDDRQKPPAREQGAPPGPKPKGDRPEGPRTPNMRGSGPSCGATDAATW